MAHLGSERQGVREERRARMIPVVIGLMYETSKCKCLQEAVRGGSVEAQPGGNLDSSDAGGRLSRGNGFEDSGGLHYRS